MINHQKNSRCWGGGGAAMTIALSAFASVRGSNEFPPRQWLRLHHEETPSVISDIAALDKSTYARK
jgi:hypothetical protein